MLLKTVYYVKKQHLGLQPGCFDHSKLLFWKNRHPVWLRMNLRSVCKYSEPSCDQSDGWWINIALHSDGWVERTGFLDPCPTKLLRHGHSRSEFSLCFFLHIFSVPRLPLKLSCVWWLPVEKVTRLAPDDRGQETFRQHFYSTFSELAWWFKSASVNPIYTSIEIRT